MVSERRLLIIRSTRSRERYTATLASHIRTSVTDVGAGTVGVPGGEPGGVAVMAMLQPFVAVPETESCALAVKEMVLMNVGVPVIAPVVAFRIRPDGSEAVMENV